MLAANSICVIFFQIDFVIKVQIDFVILQLQNITLRFQSELFLRKRPEIEKRSNLIDLLIYKII